MFFSALRAICFESVPVWFNSLPATPICFILHEPRFLFYPFNKNGTSASIYSLRMPLGDYSLNVRQFYFMIYEAVALLGMHSYGRQRWLACWLFLFLVLCPLEAHLRI